MCTHIYKHTYILRYVCNAVYIHAGILLNSFLIPRETQDFLVNFLIDGAQIITETCRPNSYFTYLGPTMAEINPHSPKSYDAFMPHPPPCSFGLLSTFSLEIIQIS